MKVPNSKPLTFLCILSFSLLFQACQPSQSDTSLTRRSEQTSESSLPDRIEPEAKDAPKRIEPSPPEKPKEITYVAEKIDPVPARLFSQSEKSRINVRSQPSTQSEAKHYGLKGDSVTLLKQATGEGNYRWYFLKFDQSNAEGWIREDFIDQSAQALQPRESYRSYDVERSPWLKSFSEEYSTATQNQEPWVLNPTQITTRLAGYSNAEDCQPDQISTFDGEESSQVTVVIQGESCGDDSVAASELRVDFVKSSQAWEIEWAGGRYRCQKGRGQQDFQPTLCL